VVIATPQLLYAWVRDSVSIEKEAVWVPGPVRMGTENLASARIWSPDCLDCGESLYRIRYSSPEIKIPISGKLRYPATPFPPEMPDKTDFTVIWREVQWNLQHLHVM
jgi:hypothetical protein